MAIPSRQIGWGTESNLLWQILKQLNKLTSVLFGLKEAATPNYKVYAALLTQSGASNPVATVLENTIGSITIIRSGVGEYRVQSSGLFTLNKTTFDITPILGFIKQDQLSNINEITFITRGTSNITSDGLLASKKLEIRVYN